MSIFTEIAAKIASLLTSPPKAAAGDWATKGPPADEHPPVSQVATIVAGHGPSFWDGWYDGARRAPAHPGRVGPAISPATVVVHTTDMMPESYDALLRGWQERAGFGNCAHFIIGRGAAQGVVQLVPITRNANHAGGKPHGWYRTPAGALVHPNTVAVGIELHAGGRLHAGPGGWVHPDTGRIIPASDVFVDTAGHGWHRVTDYQLLQLDQLLDALSPQLDRRADLTPVPDGAYRANGVAFAGWTPTDPRVVGHVTLDPVNKTDPGPQVMAHLTT